MNIRKVLKILVIISIISFIIFISWQYIYQREKNKKVSKEQKVVKVVKVVKVKDITNKGTKINLIGRVKPNKKIEVISSAQGTVISSLFEVGDKVKKDQILAYLNSDTLNTSHLNLQTNYINMVNNLESVKRVTGESVRQAELGVKKAEQSVEAAKIAVQSAEDRLNNTTSLQDKNYVDKHNQAIISFSSFLNSIQNTLNKINYIIHVDDGPQMPGISQTISAKDTRQLNHAKRSYVIDQKAYNDLKDQELTISNIKEEYQHLISVLQLTRTSLDYTIAVLDNTVSSSSLPPQVLTNQQGAYSNLKAAFVKTQAEAKGTLDSLELLELSDNSNIVDLKNSISAAQKNLELAQIGYNNAKVSLESAKQAREQQILSAQSLVDNALGQLNLSKDQMSDLTIKAPIDGQITQKMIEVGSKVMIGQRVAEISQSEKIKIEVNLPAEDIGKIKEGEEVVINNILKGIIDTINPNADEITKKIKVEILFDNSQHQLIPGTFVDVSIPVINIPPQTMLIPLSSLNISSTEKFVYVADCKDDICRAKKKDVQIGDIIDDRVRIKKGLKFDDLLLIQGNKLVKDGEVINMP